MNHYIENVTASLENIISELSDNPSLFLRNPAADFSRNRKINFKTFIGITMNSGGCTISKELLDYFDFDVNTPTVSAYTQQRAKVLPDAFEYLFHEFTLANNSAVDLYDGYQLLACDGSNLSIASNPKDQKTLRKSNQFDKSTNRLHLNVLYDILNRVFIDALVQTASERHEYKACIQMMERTALDKVILIADRGYESYNIMAHAMEKGWNYLIRVKDVHSNGIASGLDLPDTDTFDMNIKLTLTRSQAKAKKTADYKFMPSVQMFDYLPHRSKDEYSIFFRIVRLKISENSYEMLVTNLDKTLFPSEKLKELYRLRWGVETSFRELKYAIGLTNFHAKKVDYIKQEIFARLTLYNYCEMITVYVARQKNDKNKKNQVNFTVAIFICREYLRRKRNLRPPDVVKLIEKYILPVRPGRKNHRKVNPRATVSFLYRVA